MESREQWIERHAAGLRTLLADARIHVDVLALVAGDPAKERRRRRLKALADELQDMEVTWRIGGGEEA